MSILIRGMEMPKNGSITVVICSDGTIINASSDVPAIKQGYRAIEVPPHGDLIDRDAFIQFIKAHWDGYDQWFVGQLEARPTIIPAEEGEK